MFLECLDDKEMAMLESIGAEKQYPEGFHLIEEGDSGSTFFLILSGEIEVRKGMRGGKYKLLGKLGACDLVGEIGFLGDQKRTADVVAISDVGVLVFEQEIFAKFIDKNPIVGMKIYRGIAKALAQRLSHIDEDLMDAISWALAEGKGSEHRAINVPHPPQLKMRLPKI